MGKHTPGPWKIDGDRFVYSLYPDNYANRFQCSVSTQSANQASPDELKANARLISAAPTMLEALKELLNCRYVRDCEGCTKRVKDAIAAAEGEL